MANRTTLTTKSLLGTSNPRTIGAERLALGGIVSRSSPSIVPAGTEETVYLVEDCLGSLGCVWREAEVGKTDLETVIIDLPAGEYRDPRRVIAFNTAEHVARELQRRSDLTYNDVPSALQAFVDRHAGREKQLALRLV